MKGKRICRSRNLSLLIKSLILLAFLWLAQLFCLFSIYVLQVLMEAQNTHRVKMHIDLEYVNQSDHCQALSEILYKPRWHILFNGNKMTFMLVGFYHFRLQIEGGMEWITCKWFP